MAFDTLTYAKKLQEAGVPTQQAEAHAGALRELVEASLPTKQDLREMEARLEAKLSAIEVKMADLEARLETKLSAFEVKMAEMETRLLVRLGAIMVAGITILGVLMKLL